MRVKCISIRLQNLVRITDKAYKATDFNGNTDIIPASQIYGEDNEVGKSDAYWVTEWILNKKNLTCRRKKERFFDLATRRQIQTCTVEYHKPIKIAPVNENKITTLKSK